MSKSSAAAALVFACAWAATGIAAASDGLVGKWRPQDDAAAVVSIVAEGDAYQGRLVAHTEHPDRVGLHVLRDLHWHADQQRWSGKVYAARLDKVMDADVIPGGPDRFTLEVHTWLGKRKVLWDRVR